MTGWWTTSAPRSENWLRSFTAVPSEPATRTVVPKSGLVWNHERHGLRSTTFPTTKRAGGRKPVSSTTSATVPSVHRTVCCQARLHQRTTATGVCGSLPWSRRSPLHRRAPFTPM